MTNLTRNNIWILATAALALTAMIGSNPAVASTRDSTLESELLARSDSVVIGTILAATPRRQPEGRIVTDYRVRVDSVEAGAMRDPATRNITVSLPGGTIDDDGQRVFGIPILIPGDIVRLFLRNPGGATPIGDAYVVTGLGDGIRLLARNADAFTFYSLSSNPDVALRWYADTIDVHIDDQLTDDIDDAATLEAIQASLDEWNAVDCEHPTLVNVGLVNGFDAITGSGAGIHATNLIIFENTAQWDENRQDVDQWDLDTTIALTTIFHNPRTGEILNFAIEFNDERFGFAVTGIPAAVDLENTLTHELGHVFGLDHTGQDVELYWNQTMYFQAQVGETKKRSLEQDDINGLCTLYETDWSLNAETGGCSSAAQAFPWTTPLPTLVMLGAVLIIFCIRRRGY